MKVIWLDGALTDFDNILEYFKAQEKINYFEEVVARIYFVAGLLKDQPYMGRIYEGSNLREFYVVGTNYKIMYEVTFENIYIFRVFDNRQDPRNKFGRGFE